MPQHKQPPDLHPVKDTKTIDARNTQLGYAYPSLNFLTFTKKTYKRALSRQVRKDKARVVFIFLISMKHASIEIVLFILKCEKFLLHRLFPFDQTVFTIIALVNYVNFFVVNIGKHKEIMSNHVHLKNSFFHIHRFQ